MLIKNIDKLKTFAVVQLNIHNPRFVAEVKPEKGGEYKHETVYAFVVGTHRFIGRPATDFFYLSAV